VEKIEKKGREINKVLWGRKAFKLSWFGPKGLNLNLLRPFPNQKDKELNPGGNPKGMENPILWVPVKPPKAF